jgi:uncharacterized membrane protein
VRVGGFLKEITVIKDEKGNLLHRVVNPLMLEFHPRDVVQVMVGSAVLATPRHLAKHKLEFVKRVLGIYLISFGVAALFLTVIERAPWEIDAILAVKRSIIVAFPASLSAAVVDMIK